MQIACSLDLKTNMTHKLSKSYTTTVAMATMTFQYVIIARLQSTPYWLIFKIHVATIKFIFFILCRIEPKTVNYP